MQDQRNITLLQAEADSDDESYFRLLINGSLIIWISERAEDFERVYEVKCPQFEELGVVKFARFDWEIGYMEGETASYQLIEGCDIGPRFLGHLFEDGCVIGFLMERIANARHAGPRDLDICQQTLARLHWGLSMVM
ncbi:hypothetical protein N7527_000560 [Penicillium freii]|nr:hypothetical protein N7527_000560 [Penicillium freii]